MITRRRRRLRTSNRYEGVAPHPTITDSHENEHLYALSCAGVVRTRTTYSIGADPTHAHPRHPLFAQSCGCDISPHPFARLIIWIKRQRFTDVYRNDVPISTTSSEIKPTLAKCPSSSPPF